MLGHKYQCCIPLLTIGYNVWATISMLYTIVAQLLGIMLGHKYQCCIPLLTIGIMLGDKYQCCILLLTIGYNVGPQISMLYTIINYWV